MLTLHEAVDIFIEAVVDVRREVRQQLPIELTTQLSELGIVAPRQTQLLTEAIVNGLQSRNYRIDSSHLSRLNPEWRVSEIVDVMMRFALPGDETFEEPVELEPIVDFSDEDSQMATELAGDEDFAEAAGLPGREDFDES
jgi:hypothetical protein